MSLIKCPECGRQVSDKAVSCPGCGFPMNESKSREIDFHRIVDEVYNKYAPDSVKAVKEIREKTRCDLKTAYDAVYSKQFGVTPSEQDKINKIRKQEKKEQRKQELQNNLSAHCPKCHSTSISYQDKISYGRAAVGGLLAGGTGAVLGGLTGKKGYAVCLNCGKRWKV